MKARLSRHPLAALLGLLLVLYAITYHGWSGTVVDEAMMMGLTARLVEAQTIAITPLYPALEGWGAPPAPAVGPAYSKYAPGQSILGLPLYAAGSLIPSGADAVNPYGAPFLPLAPVLVTMLLGSLITVLTAAGVYAAAQLLGAGQRASLLLVVLYGVCTLSWPYAKTFYNEPSSACALVWLTVFALWSRAAHMRPPTVRHNLVAGLMAGCCAGFAILLRTSSAVFAPILLLYLVAGWRPGRSIGRDPGVQAAIAALPGIAAGVALTLAYNVARFGSALESGYEPGFGRAPWEALLGYLLSPSRSVLITNPILILSVFGVWAMVRHHGRDALLIGALALAPVAVYAGWWAWDGGASLGPRFLVPSIPLVMLFLLPWLAHCARNGRGARALILYGVAAISFAAQVFNNLALPGDIFKALFEVQGLSPNTINWVAEHALIANTWPVFAANRIDSLLLRQIPLASPLLMAMLLAGLAVSIGSAMLWVISNAQPDPHPPP